MTHDQPTLDLSDDDAERAAHNLADDISLLLDERGIDHETHIQHDGDDGWHVVITAGHAIHGSPLRELTITYITAERRWMWQAETEDGNQVGPHELTELVADASPVEVAEHLAANIGGG